MIYTKKRKPMSSKTKLKISKALKGNTNRRGMIGRKHTFEERKKLSLSMRGEKNPRWLGGLTNVYRVFRNSLNCRQWRSDIFTRDNFTCQICNDSSGGNLEAHHIKKVSIIFKDYKIKTDKDIFDCEELWNLNNGVTLCKKCHRLYHKNNSVVS